MAGGLFRGVHNPPPSLQAEEYLKRERSTLRPAASYPLVQVAEYLILKHVCTYSRTSSNAGQCRTQHHGGGRGSSGHAPGHTPSADNELPSGTSAGSRGCEWVGPEGLKPVHVWCFVPFQDLDLDLDDDLLDDLDTQVSEPVVHHMMSCDPRVPLAQGIDLDAEDEDLLQGD